MTQFSEMIKLPRHLYFVFAVFAAFSFAAFFASRVQASPPLGEVPAFKIRARILEADGKKPAADQVFKLGMEGTTQTVEWKGGEWSPWFSSTPEQTTVILDAWYNKNNGLWQVVAKAGISAGKDDTRLEVENEINGETSKSEAHLSRKGADPSHLFLAGGGWNRGMAGLPDNSILGFLIWKGDDAKIHMDTLAGHGRRVYGPTMDAAKLPENERPKQIIFTDGMRYADDDLIFIKEGLERLRGLGFNTAHPVTPNLNAAIRQAGFTHIAGMTYMPPGYVWNFKPDAERQKDITDFVKSQINPLYALGWKPEEIANWSTSDEPGWYYPDTYKEFNANPIALAAFRAYLQKQGLKPADVGKTAWNEVQFVERRAFTDLPSRRLFYWSNRFGPWASSQYFSEITKGYEAEVRPGVPVLVNFNNFTGRMYVPRPLAETARDGTGGHDWMEFGRARAATAMASEDWIDDPYAYQLSFAASRLWSASQENGSGFGFLVVPRVSGQRPFGMAQKILSLVGHGGKTVNSFTFGPEYTFPVNCYSENPQVFKPLATAMGIVGKAEDLLYPGKLRAPQVGILTPQSAQMWDLQDPKSQAGIQDGTNINLMANHMAYSSEVFGLWRALNDTGTPVAFVDEQHLSENDLKNLKVLYVTGPDLPRESMNGVLAWVRAGGTLVMSAGAGRGNRYAQADDILTKASGITLDAPLRAHVSEVRGGEFKVATEGGEALPVYGPRENIKADGAKVLRTFTDGAPAVTEIAVGKGRIQRIAVYGGVIYFLSNTGQTNMLPTGFHPGWRALLTQPVRDAKVELPVTLNQEVIEAPALYSEKGVAVTLINWSGEEKDTQLIIKTDKPVKKVESVQRGVLTFKQGAGQIALRVLVGDVDVVKVYY